MEQLQEWFLAARRALPWRMQLTPYRVWVSEVMLQQTQVDVVVPYFQRWMERYPTVEALAEAPIDEVLKQWEGLGYYARARNLHAGARQVMDQLDGELPITFQQLRQIRGIGPYTANAILAFAFQQPVIAVDGNVLRVASRYFGLEDDIAQPKTRRVVEERLQPLLPPNRPWEVSEALIELGATVCTRSPQCERCPLVSGCQASATGRQHELPIKSRRQQYEILHRVVTVILTGQQMLLRRGEPGAVMADLYEFPYFSAVGPWRATAVAAELQRWNLQAQSVKPLAEVGHSFTRYRARLYPWRVEVKQAESVERYQWVARGDVAALPFSSGHRRVLGQLS